MPKIDKSSEKVIIEKTQVTTKQGEVTLNLNLILTQMLLPYTKQVTFQLMDQGATQ